jgi:hypothetical protein
MPAASSRACTSASACMPSGIAGAGPGARRGFCCHGGTSLLRFRTIRNPEQLPARFIHTLKRKPRAIECASRNASAPEPRFR